MTHTIYDQHAEFYISFIQNVSTNRAFLLTIQTILAELGDLDGLEICDLACGEGVLSRILAAQGAQMSGFDLSSRLIDHARKNSDPTIAFAVNDAQTLVGVPNSTFDVVVCHMAIMDIPNIDALFATTKRILKPNGRFVLTVLHPCFETPFKAPKGIVETDENGAFVACRVMNYKEEGLWNSGGVGVRGHMGAYHRKLSTYMNALVSSGFTLYKLAEPMLTNDNYESMHDQWEMKIPRRLTIFCTA